jgi:hypothetical protein
MQIGFSPVQKDLKDRPSRVRVPYTQYIVLSRFPTDAYEVAQEFLPRRLGKTMPYTERVKLESKAHEFASKRENLPVGALALTVEEGEFHYSDLTLEELNEKGISISGGLLPFTTNDRRKTLIEFSE